MICHRTIGPAQAIVTARDAAGSPFQWVFVSEGGRDCIGSRCSMWVPASRNEGRGYCGEIHRLDGQTWDDPAQTKEGT